MRSGRGKLLEAHNMKRELLLTELPEGARAWDNGSGEVLVEKVGREELSEACAKLGMEIVRCWEEAEEKCYIVR